MRGSRPEARFLPAALAVEETPPRRAARALLYAVVLFCGVAIAWAMLGRVDIVAQAPGRVVSTGRTKIIQPHEHAVLKTILVHEGQRVVAGQPLIELDATAPTADLARLREDHLALTLDRARLQALLETDRLQTDTNPFAAFAPAGTLVRQARARWQQQRAGYRAMLDGFHDTRRERRAERAAVDAHITRLTATLPLATEAAEAHRVLTGRGVVPRVQWLQVERERIAVQQELAAQREERRRLSASLDALVAQRRLNEAQLRAEWTAELAVTQRQLAATVEALTKARRRIALMTLLAPVAGTVQQLAVHTDGGAVTQAQPLMLIVPADAPLEIEARVHNRDSGFVREGQSAVVKVDTYPFTKYGHLTGTVVQVSRDAVIEEDQPPYYLAHLALREAGLLRDGRVLPLEAGMTVTVEVMLGERRVIEFLLSPLLRYRHESGRER